MHRIAEIYAWVGLVAILAAYTLASFSYLEPTSIWYFMLNLFGAIGLSIDAYLDKNYQPVVLNVVWALVALIGIVRFFTAV
jgi:hypothetical protein